MTVSTTSSYARFISLRRLIKLCHESYIQHQCYHSTPNYYKIRMTKEQKVNNMLKHGNTETNVHPKEKKTVPVVKVWNNITIKQLATSANRDVNQIMNILNMMNVGTYNNPNTAIVNFGLVCNVVKKLGCKTINVPEPNVKVIEEIKYKDIVRSPPADKSVLVKRHPVVTVMGHVDHGKTTLLDSLRNTSVVDTEFGGITQHIGAFNVTLKSGEQVTFLDTPGHAAFTAMRYRGAHVTDIVVLVVAADDGVKEQTLQSIEMAKDANVPIIVAINKIDKPNANIKRTQQMLQELGIVVEDLGGDVQCVNVSALKGTNLDILTEAIVLQAELMGLKGDPVGLVEGVAIECANHAGRGKLVTTLIKRGTLKNGSLLVSGLAWAKVRSMFNEFGRPVAQAKPSEAVQIIGWKVLPQVGAEILEARSEKELNSAIKYRESLHNDTIAKQHHEAADKKYQEYLLEYKRLLQQKWILGWYHPQYKSLKKSTSVKNEEKEEQLEYNCIIKGDVAGSVEAILNILDTYTANDLCKLNIISYGVGPVNESDVELAESFNATIYRFNVVIPRTIENQAVEKNIQIRKCNVIYKLVDTIKEEINSKLPKTVIEETLGEANVMQQFQINDKRKKVNVAGCLCTKGVLQKSGMYNLIRNNEIIYTGKMVSMRHLKDEVSKIETDVECGLRLDNPTLQFQPGDTLVCFILKEVPQTIGWNPGF
ncbi:mitochondrial translation initiation factor 2 isoform X2 [Megalopta genalis]|uniref:mitochondrial translation initiation factor 2 isoform X2 n=1 Tax=Megalopta genalis TaxID=115081 RepID=UPI003FD44E40